MAGKTFRAFPAHAHPANLRIWQEACGVYGGSNNINHTLWTQYNIMSYALARTKTTDDISITKQCLIKPCAYFMEYTVCAKCLTLSYRYVSRQRSYSGLPCHSAQLQKSHVAPDRLLWISYPALSILLPWGPHFRFTIQQILSLWHRHNINYLQWCCRCQNGSCSWLNFQGMLQKLMYISIVM